jgi:hypothetical protein
VSFWTDLFGTPNHAGVKPNDNPAGVPPASVAAPDYTPGDPDGVELQYDPVQARSHGLVMPSPWDGWPAEWSTPHWDWGGRFNALVDIAWACIDRQSQVLSAMDVYRTRGGRIIDNATWMTNPDPAIYSSWAEFAKQLFRDYMMGEAFVWPTAVAADGYPLTFRVVPPWMVDVEMSGGQRRYRLGGPAGPDVSDEILHIRYDSSTDSPRGRGPLEAAGARQVTAGLIEKYTREVVSSGGITFQYLKTDQPMTEEDAQGLQNDYMAARRANFAAIPVFDNGVDLVSVNGVPPKDMAMLEIAQFTEARICILLGVPPFMMGLPSGDSMTYSNVSQVHDYHDRLSIQPMTRHVMSAVSGWALPSTQRAELNRDAYSRPDFVARAGAYKQLVEAGVMTPEMVRVAEQMVGESSEPVTVDLLSAPSEGIRKTWRAS